MRLLVAVCACRGDWCSEQYPEKLGTYIQDMEASTEFPAYTKQEHTLFYLQVISSRSPAGRAREIMI